MALSTLFQVLLRALVSIVVQLKWRPPLDDAIVMYFPADPASLHSFLPCLLYQQRGILFIVPVKKYRLLFIRFITGIFGRGIGTLTVRVYRCGPLVKTFFLNLLLPMYYNNLILDFISSLRALSKHAFALVTIIYYCRILQVLQSDVNY